MVARRATALVLAAALATGLAACGGGDDDEGSSDDVQLEDVGSDANADDSSSDDSSSDSSSDDEDATDVTVDGDVIEGAFSDGCGEFINVFTALGGAISGAFDADAAQEFEAFVDDAPDEVQDDLEVIAEAYQTFAAALEDAGFDPEDPESFDPSNVEALQVFSEASEGFSTPEFTEASNNVNEFIASNCEG